MTGGRGRHLEAGPFLLELCIAILVFALAAGAILTLSAAARQKSDDASVLSSAVLAATTAADYLRAGDEAGFCQAFGAERTEAGFVARGVLCQGEKAETGFLLTVQKSVNGSLSSYSIDLTDEGGNGLVSLVAAWVDGGDPR
ncbi:MAG: type IV pilus modification PilV family protein [Christensenellales bacterium]|jgi:type II secretory pathway pseudopilin PulG